MAMRTEAQSPGTSEQSSSSMQDVQYLSFMRGAEMLAIGILGVKEIIEFGDVTPIPAMPDYVRGVINLRGAAVPVLDLSVRFGGSPTAVTRRTCIVIAEVTACGARQDLGIIVDAVHAVLDIPAHDIEALPKLGAAAGSELMRGVARLKDRFVMILDVDKLLPDAAAETWEMAAAPAS
jgi:purine-binding chemotaxis protein CheW